MPCRDYPLEGSYSTTTVENPVTKKKLDNVTRLLCGLCKRSTDAKIAEVPELWAWWQKHQEEDRKRAAEEFAQKRLEEQYAREQIQKLAKKHNLKVDIK